MKIKITCVGCKPNNKQRRKNKMADNYNLLNDFMEQLHNAVHEHNKEQTLEHDFDTFVVTKFNDDGYFNLIECMSPEGMLALCTTIVDDWMSERVKPEITISHKHKIVDDFMESMREVLHDNLE